MDWAAMIPTASPTCTGLSCCHVGTVTFCADTQMGFTCQDGTDLHLFDLVRPFSSTPFVTIAAARFGVIIVICFDNHIAFSVADRLAGITSCDTLLKAFNLFISVRKCLDIHSRDFFFPSPPRSLLRG